MQVSLPTRKNPQCHSCEAQENSKKKSTFASNRIEGNPLTEEQANAAIDGSRRHYIRPEEEIRNYYAALEFLDEQLAQSTPFSTELTLEVQRLVVKGESAEKTGLRKPMPPGVLFAVYDSETSRPEYIPPCIR